MSFPVPRVNAAALKDRIGHTVTLTCEVIQAPSRPSFESLLRASDGGQITAKFHSDPQELTKFISITADVKTATVVQVRSVTCLGENLRLDVVDRVLHYTMHPSMDGIFFGEPEANEH